MGMEMGKYSMDKDRYNSMTGPNCGYDREFTMREWKRFIFKGTQKKASIKKKKNKRNKTKKRKKSKRKKSKKKKSKRKNHLKKNR